jgi:glycerol-3-phosphate acyltransferase PlsY
VVNSLLFVLAAYLIGSLSFAVLVSRAFGLPDPHSYGSGNPGATNVLRTGRKAAAALTLAGDGAKGWLALFLAQQLGPRLGVEPWTYAAVLLAVFLGHLFPVFFGFKGGKGVATALGILLAVNVWLGLATLATWIIIVVFFRISSLAALIAAVFAPVYHAFLFGPQLMTAAIAAMSLLVLMRHKDNIRRLLAGEEGRIGGGRSRDDSAPGSSQTPGSTP